MKIILTCGHPFSGFDLAGQMLSAAGVQQAQPSKREALAPASLQSKIASAYKVNLLSGAPLEQLNPGKMWQELTVDLFLANQDSEQWGWADPQTVCLLDYWREFDPQVRFVLVYSAPEYTLGQQLRKSINPAEEIKTVLKAWLEVNSQLLSFYNRYQDRCLLVNAAAVRTDPAGFAEKAARLFGLELIPATPADNFCGQKDAAITAILARTLVEGCDEATSLYNELESSADLSLTACNQTEPNRFLAWQEYVGLLTGFEKETTEAKQSTERLLTAARAEATTRAEADSKESELLKLQLHQIQEELEHYLLRCQELEKDVNEKVKLLADAAKLKTDGAEAAKENELLLLQLHQVQEELEHYFILYQELSQMHKQSVNEEGRLRDRLLLDLRTDFDGYNWYEAETEGRWAGPGTTSSIRFPQLAEGEYLLELDINNAMAPEIMQEMELSFNGSAIEFAITGQLPVTLTGRIVQKQLDAAAVNTLLFKFPKVISPAEHGSDDQRRLTIQPIYLSIKQAKYSAAETSAQAKERRLQLEDASLKQRELEGLLAAMNDAASRNQEEIARLTLSVAETAKEKELLLIQLHNIQEVQDHYSTLFHKLEQQNRQYLRDSLLLDFRNEFDGDNWYDAESDGRWAGPDTASSIRMPPLMPGAYTLELEVVDAMAAEIFENIEITVNGKSVAKEKENRNKGVLSGLRKDKKLNRGIVLAKFSIDSASAARDAEIQFNFPKVICPADHGADDQRALAAKCSYLRVTRNR